MNEEFLYVTILDRPALFHYKPLEEVPTGLFCYHLNDTHGCDYPDQVSTVVGPDYWGTILLREPLNLDSPEVKNAKHLMFAYYEDFGGNPIPITAADYLAGVEPAVLTEMREMDENERAF